LDTDNADTIKDAAKALDAVCQIGGAQLPNSKDEAVLSMVEGTMVLRAQNDDILVSSSSASYATCI
jgi:hypothetical protein